MLESSREFKWYYIDSIDNGLNVRIICYTLERI